MFGLENLDVLFAIWAFLFQIILIVYFALWKLRFNVAMRYGPVVYALSIPAAVISMVLLVGGKTWSFWLGGFIYLVWAVYGYLQPSHATHFVLVSTLTGLVFADAFFYPAQSSMAPQLVKKDHLQVAKLPTGPIHGTREASTSTPRATNTRSTPMTFRNFFFIFPFALFPNSMKQKTLPPLGEFSTVQVDRLLLG